MVIHRCAHRIIQFLKQFYSGKHPLRERTTRTYQLQLQQLKEKWQSLQAILQECGVEIHSCILSVMKDNPRGQSLEDQ